MWGYLEICEDADERNECTIEYISWVQLGLY